MTWVLLCAAVGFLIGGLPGAAWGVIIAVVIWFIAEIS